MRWSFIPEIPFTAAWDLQKALRDEVLSGREEVGFLLLVTHPPTVTCGVRDAGCGLLLSGDQYAARGIDLQVCDRGGLATYHGPGQLVGYPVVRLAAVGAPRISQYIRLLEEVMRLICLDCGVKAELIEGRPGLWTGGRKIGSVGVHVHQGVSYHGFALNVDTAPSAFEVIVPCGIAGCKATSLKNRGAKVGVKDVIEPAALHCGRVFGVEMERADLKRFGEKAE